jgi:archaemetzincin
MFSNCDHAELVLQTSSHAETAGYIQLDASKLVAATAPSGRVNKSAQITTNVPLPSTFPAPLVLPEDDLAYDSRQPGQSVRAWIQMKTRNEVTSRRKTIYVVDPSKCDDSSLRRQLENWTRPRVGKTNALKVDKPSTQDIVDYLQAFYHGMNIKQLNNFFKFTSWDGNESPNAEAPNFIGLIAKKEVVRIRTRPCPDQVFQRQLNLNDLLDACISALPGDAHSLILLTYQDLYEDDEDDFCCGRAYGGSRVAVVSSARYHPILDEMQDVERVHAWPASHCAVYVKSCCLETSGKKAAKKRRIEQDQKVAKSTIDSPMQAAIWAYISAPSILNLTDPKLLTGLWFSRVCRTVSHELGHCFGIAHCAYYACSMQGTASIAEDARQPPYLCPVDLAKVLKATGADEIDRYRALLAFCKKQKDVHLFVAFGAWIKSVLESKAQK